MYYAVIKHLEKLDHHGAWGRVLSVHRLKSGAYDAMVNQAIREKAMGEYSEYTIADVSGKTVANDLVYQHTDLVNIVKFQSIKIKI